MRDVPAPLAEMLDDLRDLAMDFWWTTQPDADGLWSSLDRDLWEVVNHNPVALLHDMDPDSAPPGWENQARDMLNRWRAYHLAPKDLAPKDLAPKDLAAVTPRVALFCMEFGLHESLPIYSGGLGVQAGDHLRSASDLGLDLVAVGLFYSRGYCRQLVHDGQQVAAYPKNDPARLAMKPALDQDGRQVEIDIPHSRHSYRARVWEVRVGRVRLFLLDTDYDANPVEYRVLTRNLYGGTAETRLAQEVLLGIGGVRALAALGIERDTFHINEGHSAFLVLALWAQALNAHDCSADQAWERARLQCVFTTHSPVPAGHDRFPWSLVDPALGGLREQLGLPQGAFMDRGRGQPGDIHEPLSTTALAIKGSRACNGISRLHGQESRRIWRDLGAPIGHITSGVHPTAWLGPAMAHLFDARLPGWRSHICDRTFWQRARQLPPDELDRAKAMQRHRLVDAVRWRTGRPVLERARLTIGFARRFAGFKRGALLFSDPDRLLQILDQGVQVVFAGKAHPEDTLGQALLAEVVRWTHRPGFRGRVVFVPNYDMALGRLLTQGADVWLNNPRRLREGCGTSGQKAAINGGLNLSVLDGWWPEAFDGDNGWAIGSDQDLDDTRAQDAADAESLYRCLEDDVLPAWADSWGWTERALAAIATCMPVFNSHRMVADYQALLYRPAQPDQVAIPSTSTTAAPDPRLLQPHALRHMQAG
ncbi:MAG: glycosyltransferase family 1 protein [Oligoflexia bacterium]|nr:glycosyltransferase family 1 protein [Oligoflexia bacterium]